MRDDMDKLIYEKPRSKGCGKAKLRHNRHITKQVCKIATVDTDIETPDFKGMRKVHTSTPYSWDDRKHWNKNVNPLRRFLRSRVGMKWDDVYSEIMAGLNMSSHSQYNVWKQLIQWGEVETKTYMEGNAVMCSGVCGPSRVDEFYWQEAFYVDPRDGLLCCTKKKDTNKNYNGIKKVRLNSFRYIDRKKPLLQYHMINGIWYEIGLRHTTDEEKKNKKFNYVRLEDDGNPGCYRMIVRSYSGESILGARSKLGYRIIEEVAIDRGIYRGWGEDGLWQDVVVLFGGPYFPITKRQISSREVKKIESLKDAFLKKAA